MKIVSVIIPVYNVEKYLEECLNSVINQTHDHLEIILVDDGSTDSSGHICDRYAMKDNRIRVIHQENQGAAQAKNAGLDSATGDYIAFVDSDDYVADKWLETLMSAIEDNHADVVECCFEKVYRDERVRETVFLGEKQCYTAEEYLSFYLSDWTCSLFWNKLFAAKLLHEIRFRRERRCIDDEFFTYKALSMAERIVRVNESLYSYRQRLSSAVFSENHQLQITRDALEILIERYQWIKIRFPKLSNIYYSHDVEILNYFATSFNFDENSVIQFKNVLAFYRRRVMCHFSKNIMAILFRLSFLSKELMLRKKPQNSVEDKEKYYV